MGAASQAFQNAGFVATGQGGWQQPTSEPVPNQQSDQQTEKPMFAFEQQANQQRPEAHFEFNDTQESESNYQNEQDYQGDSQEPDYSYLSNVLGGRFSNPEELEAYVSELEGREPSDEIFASDYVRNLNEAIRAGIDPEVFNTVASLDLDEMSPKDALILQYQMKDGLSWEDAELLVNETYRLDDEMYSDDDPQTKMARIKAKVDANEAYEFLTQFQQEALTPPIERQIEMQKRAWEPVLPKVLDSFKTLEFEGKAGKYQFPVSQESQRAAQELFAEVLDTGIIDAMPDEQGMEFAKNLVYKELVMREAVNMLDMLVEKLRMQQISGKHNPSGNRMFSSSGAPAPDDKNSLYEFLAAAKGMKFNNV